MKGFLYLVEIAVAAILVAIILGSFFAAQAVRVDWTRADLIAVGNNVFDILGRDIVFTLNSTFIFDEMNLIKPSNVKYTLRFKGIPKQTIYVGTNELSDIAGLLDESYVNGRNINYDITGFSSGDDLDQFDILVLKDYTDYSEKRITDFAENKPVIGIENELTTGNNFKNFFDLSSGSGLSVPLDFVEYNDIAKYFMGIGFIIETPYQGATAGTRKGYWDIWGVDYPIVMTDQKVCFQENCNPNTAGVSARETFSLTGHPETFLVKKIVWPNSIYFAVWDDNFVFNSNFVDVLPGDKLKGNNIIGNDDYSAMTKSGNKIWISEFDMDSEEYKTLVQAATAGSVTDWYMEEPEGEETVEVSRFTTLCCDIPEIVEIAFVLWYVF